jgi:hypothetical protein
MADIKLQSLPAVTSLSTGDLIPVTVDPGGTPLSKNITRENIAADLMSLPATSLTASLPVFTDANKKLVSKSVANTRTALGLGTADNPTFAGETLSGLTASLPVFTDANKALISKSIADTQTALLIPGAWTTPTFSAGNFTASGSMTWTVESGDVTTYTYAILNKTMFLSFYIITTTVGGTPSTSLKIAIPGSKSSAKSVRSLVFLSDNGVALTGYADTGISGTVITIYKPDYSNFTASTNNTQVLGTLTFEIN